MTHKINIRPEDLVFTEYERAALAEIEPLSDNVIIRVIDNEAKSAGGIVLTKSSVEKSTLGVVLKPNKVSYRRDGTEKPVSLKELDIVRLQRGNVGTEMPEAPESQKWLAVPEDCIYYYRRIPRG